MHYASASDGTKIAYRKVGDGSRVVVFVHGWTMSGAVYDDVLEHVDRTGLTLLVVDLRGAGASDKPDDRQAYSIAHCAGAVLAVADAGKVAYLVVVRHSMRGQDALWLEFLLLIDPQEAYHRRLGSYAQHFQSNRRHFIGRTAANQANTQLIQVHHVLFTLLAEQLADRVDTARFARHLRLDDQGLPWGVGVDLIIGQLEQQFGRANANAVAARQPDLTDLLFVDQRAVAAFCVGGYPTPVLIAANGVVPRAERAR